MEINPAKIKDLLRNNLVIPDNQRGYDWKEIHADDFWDDIFESEVNADQRDFYLGTILLLHRDGDSYEIVDGQQRITTIFIFLIALRQYAKKYEFSRVDYPITEYINSKHHSFQASPTIEKALSIIKDIRWDGKFKDILDKEIGQRKAERITYQNRRIKPVYDFFTKKIKELVNNFESENEIYGREKRLDALEDFFISLSNKVEEILVTNIKIDDVEEAFLLFERLNARGASLSVTDLLKNHLFSKEIPDLKERWDAISQSLENEKGLSILQMIRYFYMSKFGHVTKSQLYRNLKNKCVKPNPKKFVDEIEEFSNFYKDVSSIGHNDEEKSKTIINRFNIRLSESTDRHFSVFKSLSGLTRYGIRQTVPLIFSYLSKFEELNLDQDENYRKVILIFFEFLERLHFINNFVLSEPTNQVEKIYSNYAALFNNVKSKDEFDVLEHNLIKELKRAPLADFVEEFTSLNYTSDNKKIKEILARIKMVNPKNGECLPQGIAKNYFLDPSLKNDSWNTEHWLAQNADSNLIANLENKEDLHNIGNLILMLASLNSSVQNLSPSRKVEQIETNEKNMRLADENLKTFIQEHRDSHENWDSSVINKRAEKLAKASYNVYWRFNYPTRRNEKVPRI